MFKKITIFQKIALAVLVLAVGLAMTPISRAAAAAGNDQDPTHPDGSLLERIWAREQRIYRLEERGLAHSDELIARMEKMINRANGKGWDTSSLQAALDAFSAVIPAATAAHEPGAAIIASHAGFDENGKVTDWIAAVTTENSLSQVLKATRSAMNGTGKALLVAIKAFRQAHPRPTSTPGL